MVFSESEIKQIIERVTAEIKHKINSGDTGSVEQTEQNTAVLIPGFFPGKEKALAQYTGAQVFSFSDANIASAEQIKTMQDHHRLMDILYGMERVVLLAPSIHLLAAIGDGADSGFVESAVIRSILWDKDVQILLDFELPKFRRSRLLTHISEAVESLESAGVTFKVYSQSKKMQKTGMSLVTENDIVDVYKSGGNLVQILPGAIVTPLAVDKAKELGIIIKN